MMKKETGLCKRMNRFLYLENRQRFPKSIQIRRLCFFALRCF